MSILNQANVRKLIKRKAEHMRGGRFTRISKSFLIDLEYKVETMIESAIRNHPSVGRTLDEFRP